MWPGLYHCYRHNLGFDSFEHIPCVECASLPPYDGPDPQRGDLCPRCDNTVVLETFDNLVCERCGSVWPLC